ncbi:MAG: hypothetical protein ACOCQD_02935 [archaeon]
MNDGWVSSNTLGKGKLFYWKVDDDCNVHIKREFKNWKVETVSYDHLNKLNNYMSVRNRVGLKNNVKKLSNVTEDEGIGSFLYNLHEGTSYAQLSSHLSALFNYAGIWEHNGKHRNMEFKLISDNWCRDIKNYYQQKVVK